MPGPRGRDGRPGPPGRDGVPGPFLVNFGARCGVLKPGEAFADIGPDLANLAGEYVDMTDSRHLLLPNGNAQSIPAQNLQTATFKLPFDCTISELMVHAGDAGLVDFVRDESVPGHMAFWKELVGKAVRKGQRVGVSVRMANTPQEVLVTLMLCQV